MEPFWNKTDGGPRKKNWHKLQRGLTERNQGVKRREGLGKPERPRERKREVSTMLRKGGIGKRVQLLRARECPGDACRRKEEETKKGPS